MKINSHSPIHSYSLTHRKSSSNLFKTLGRGNDKTSLSSYIRLFEPLVIKALKVIIVLSASIPLLGLILLRKTSIWYMTYENYQGIKPITSYVDSRLNINRVMMTITGENIYLQYNRVTQASTYCILWLCVYSYYSHLYGYCMVSWCKQSLFPSSVVHSVQWCQHAEVCPSATDSPGPDSSQLLPPRLWPDLHWLCYQAVWVHWGGTDQVSWGGCWGSYEEVVWWLCWFGTPVFWAVYVCGSECAIRTICLLSNVIFECN